MNGTHGQVFQTAFQPLFRLPFANRILHAFLNYLKSHPSVLKSAVTCLWKRKFLLGIWIRIYRWMFQTRTIGTTAKSKDYLGDIISTPQHMYDYLCLFEELDAHSVYHLLPFIEHPTLIICGGLDCLTPPYQSYEMYKR